MPEHTIILTDADCTLIERVQLQLGLPSLEAAAEWLVKARLRRAARATTGRGRALYLVDHTGTRRIGASAAPSSPAELAVSRALLGLAA